MNRLISTKHYSELHQFLRIAVLVICSSLMAVQAADPSWWHDPTFPVIDSTLASKDNAPVALGQAKWMVARALATLKVQMPQLEAAIEGELVGEGRPIPSLDVPAAGSPAEKAQHAPLTIGQLKALAKPFYDHLNDVAPSWLAAQRTANMMPDTGTPFPWTHDVSDDLDGSMAKIGQLKAVFSLRFDQDSDGDAMTDLWESYYAHQLLSLGKPATFWGMTPGGALYYTQLLAGDIDPNHSYLGTGTASQVQAAAAQAYGENIDGVPASQYGEHFQIEVLVNAPPDRGATTQWVDYWYNREDGNSIWEWEEGSHDPHHLVPWALLSATSFSPPGTGSPPVVGRIRFYAPDLATKDRRMTIVKITDSSSIEAIDVLIPAGEQYSDWTDINPNGHHVVFSNVFAYHVGRDDMATAWNLDGEVLFDSVDVYGGEFAGDFIKWVFPTVFQDADTKNYTWSAVNDDDQSEIDGPTGYGKFFWQLSTNGNDPMNNRHLTWKPGNYTIKVAFDGHEYVAGHLRHLGYRSTPTLIIGQIVPTDQFNPNDPTKNSGWADAVSDDLSTMLDFGHDSASNASYTTLYNFTYFGAGKATELWSGLWSGALAPGGFVIPGGLGFSLSPLAKPTTSQGPFIRAWGIGTPRYVPPLSSGMGIGTVTPEQNYWMTQHMLNINPDDVASAPSRIPVLPDGSNTDYASVMAKMEYRIFHTYQVKFFLDDQFKIDKSTAKDLKWAAVRGPTKFNFGVDASDLFGVISNLQGGVRMLTVPSTGNPYNDNRNFSGDGMSVSYYATARIGEEGRRISFRQFGKDAPWIFSEIIVHVDSSTHIVDLRLRASTSAQWDRKVRPDAGIVVSHQVSPGHTEYHPFNNLNIYLQEDKDAYTRRDILPMQDHLKQFLESTPTGVWGSPDIEPSLLNGN